MFNLLGKQSCFSTVVNLAGESRRQRNRLKKDPPPLGTLNCSCDQRLDVILSENYLIWHPNQNDATAVYQGNPELPRLSEAQSKMPPKQSSDSISVYSLLEANIEELRRTRAKTPVFRIGQLEEAEAKPRINAAELARQYQAALPPRAFTPCPFASQPNIHRNGLRRIKCHESLRDTVKYHPEKDQSAPNMPDPPSKSYPEKASPPKLETSFVSAGINSSGKQRPPGSQLPRGSFESRSTRRHSSDSETLLGSDSEMHPDTPALNPFSNSDLDAIKPIRDNHHSTGPDPAMPDNDIGMELCIDLLATNLAAALHRQHPTGPGNSASRLQMLLLIEAYESLQQKMRQQQQLHATDGTNEHVGMVDDALDHWLQALSSVHESSSTQGCAT